MIVRMKRRPVRALLLAAALAGCWSLTRPAITRQGVNFRVTEHAVPQYAKAVDFLRRDGEYRALAAQIVQGLHTDRERALAVFEWTRGHIRPIPQGWPVVDDHVWHIIIRGYGTDDQMADVFTTLCAYAGVPSYWRFLRHPETGAVLTVSLARLNGRWAVFDVQHDAMFQDAQGGWLTPQELAADPALSHVADRARVLAQAPYPAYFADPAFLALPPSPLRPELQMPGPRLAYEARRALHLAGVAQ